jgi:hypothetical protein
MTLRTPVQYPTSLRPGSPALQASGGNPNFHPGLVAFDTSSGEAAVNKCARKWSFDRTAPTLEIVRAGFESAMSLAVHELHEHFTHARGRLLRKK